MSSIKLSGDAWAKLADIKKLALSSSSSIAGNIGMFNGRAIKFNTHIGERLTSSTTDEMRAASRAMRQELSGIVDDLFKGNEDQISKFKQMFDSGNKTSLLERKVVAKVIEEIEKEGGHTLDAGDLSRYSSEHKKTTFDVVSSKVIEEIEKEGGHTLDADNLLRCSSKDHKPTFTKVPTKVNTEVVVETKADKADKAKSFMVGMKSWIEYALTENGVQFKEGEKETLEKFWNFYAEELGTVGITEKGKIKYEDFVNGNNDVRNLVDKQQVVNTKEALVFLARLAMGGKHLPSKFVNAGVKDWTDTKKNAESQKKLSTVFNFADGVGLGVALKLAKGHEKLFARLLAHCSVSQSVQIFSQLNESELSKLEDAPLDNAWIYEKIVGSKPDADVKGMTSAELMGKCDAAVFMKDFPDGRSAKNAASKLSLTQGKCGIVLSPEMADKMVNREAKVVDGKVVNYNLEDLKAFGEGCSVVAAKDKTWDEIVNALKVDCGRMNNPIFDIFGTKVDSKTDYITADTVKEKVLDPIYRNTSDYTSGAYNGISKAQAHVAGIMLSQRGLALTDGLLVNDEDAGIIEKEGMSFKLEKQGEDVVLSVESQKRDNRPYLFYAFTIKPDGANELSAFEYKPVGWEGRHSTFDAPRVVVPDDPGKLGKRSYDKKDDEAKGASNAANMSWKERIQFWMKDGVPKHVGPRDFCSIIAKAFDRYSQENNAFFASGMDAMKKRYITFLRNLNFLIEDELKAEIYPSKDEDDEFADYVEKPFKQRMVRGIMKEIEDTLVEGMDEKEKSVKEDLLKAFSALATDLRDNGEWI